MQENLQYCQIDVYQQMMQSSGFICTFWPLLVWITMVEPPFELPLGFLNRSSSSSIFDNSFVWWLNTRAARRSCSPKKSAKRSTAWHKLDHFCPDIDPLTSRLSRTANRCSCRESMGDTFSWTKRAVPWLLVTPMTSCLFWRPRLTVILWKIFPISVFPTEQQSAFSPPALANSFSSFSALADTPTPIKMILRLLTLSFWPITAMRARVCSREDLECSSSPSVRMTWAKFHLSAVPVFWRSCRRSMRSLQPLKMESLREVPP